ncbi:TetR/AcrR family transcriptional regulator [Pseudoteredinibacter isoporae]|uniref:AcrR family transcriptional regulator n=1 Tax=Pseudoteredinibacter isoporae TaxID=570281 RepID=A0A7X0MVB6_9GAMM|nr:TetR family transcriptional regulator [Pseudoteredinibacter isoporae]MBB6520920.1 AcrR family transcriptional regulator [Pseudoteredinibacter isoporae]NHO86485.1 TetR/AcrR family transcriptional regulator [Pseudoteredinibacter isoporae]NIB25063.1 TetR/AcrR family transcriptional regulator [Pseudoteredinibacter isoporae]
MAQQSAKTSSRGEQTRQQILDAALRVLAQQGYRALTHRAIAKEAGVSLSLTTYHFKDLEALLHDAFAYYKHSVLNEFEGRWEALYEEYLLPSLEQARRENDRTALVEMLAKYMTELIESDIAERSEGVAVEMTFHFDLHLEEEQRNFAYELCNRLFPRIHEFYRQMKTKDPETDANLLLDVAHFLRFRRLAVPEMLSREDVYLRLHRLLTTQLVSG